MESGISKGRAASLLTLGLVAISTQLAVADVNVIPANGGTGISADRAANSPTPAWTSLGKLRIAEKGDQWGDIGGGTLVLKAPAGFEFNTGVTPNISYKAKGDITNATIQVTDNTTLTIALGVSGTDSKDTVLIGDSIPIQVRPLAGTPLASGSIYRPAVGGGSATIVGVVASSNPDGSGGTSFGDLATVPGALAQLSFQTPPPATAFVATPFSPAPAVYLEDQFGNVRIGDNSSVVQALLKSGSGILTGTSATASSGLAIFTSLTYDQIETISLTFSLDGLTLDSGDINVTLPGLLFYDSFVRTNDPGDPAPWVVESGVWRTSAGSLLGGTNDLNSYGFVYLTNSWTNYTFQALVQLPANAFGGGIGGRLDPLTGAHYAAWIYPEGSAGGSDVVRLFKFSDWTTFAELGEANVGSVGTNSHAVKLVFQDNNLAVYYDGLRLISAVDESADPYLTGGLVLGFWTADTGYEAAFDEAMVFEYDGPIASNDTYSTTSGSTLSVPAPGVLANDLVAGTNVSAILATTVANGTLSLSNDGSFTYTAPASFSGTATFTYTVSDGTTDSAPATVTIKVAAPTPPIANPASYSTPGDTVLTLPAPGVLANDTDPNGQPLTALLATNPASGTLSLNPDGSFSYYPASSFSGNVTFSYRAADMGATSAPVNVTISVGAVASPLFSDNFTRTNDPGSLAPWIAQSGNWLVSGGMLTAGINSTFSYGYLITPSGWVDYSIQASVSFPVGAFGGGIGGRLDPLTGAHYAAWIYPAGSSGGSNVLRLIKFQSWTAYGYNNVPGAYMAQASLPDVGTSWHTLTLAFQGSQISAYFDGTLEVSTNDTETPVYPGGAASLELWTDATGYQMEYENVVVSALAAPAQAGLLSIKAQAPGGVVISYQGGAGDNTILFGSTGFMPPITWTPLATNVAGPDGKWSYTNSLCPQGHEIYRVLKQ